ncbi:MAG: MFS transporter [Saprospiraceae bacterium]|nr:MAG: MFS transporter [Saprospiraceae bacterium]
MSAGRKEPRIFTRTVVILGFISLFTDMASEMLYPVLPLYLEQIGFGVVGIGILEGVAQGVAGLSKGWFGQLSDRTGRRLPFVRWGYGLSAVAKPLMAIWAQPLWVLFARTLDRLGKGVRTAARDALLSAEGTAAVKGRIFGFHRGMDTLGAAIGPALAVLWLWHAPEQYRPLFFIALLPGLLAVGLTLLLKEKTTETAQQRPWPGFVAFLKYPYHSEASYRRLLIGLLAFALINSSDFFLLLFMKEKGLSDSLLIGAYILYNLVYAAVALPAGWLADRLGMHRVFLMGLLCFSVVYGAMPLVTGWWAFALLLALYGCFAAATEGVSKAWISNLVSKEEVATAIGTYEALRSVAVLIASSVAGLIWAGFGASALMIFTALATLLVAAWIYFRVPPPRLAV